ncbi:MAG: hypothetical protein CR968_00270 [Flavobacteriia bacterium]|nr:MAG: hypothetical protein CR968_00270 [Flavobacteriia bacterium]
MSSKPKIIVDIERMKYPFTGLFYFCQDLALSLDKYYKDTYDFYFFSYPNAQVPGHLKLIKRKLLDKVFIYPSKKYQIWHITWQDTKYMPKNDIKIVYTIHDLNFLYTDKPKHKKKALLEAVQNKVNRADVITVISNFVKNDVIKNLDVKGKEIHVIYNGVDLKEYPAFDQPKYRPEKKFFFTIGTVLPKKNFHVLPSLISDSDYELIIAGIHMSSDYVNTIMKEAEAHQVQDRVHLIDSVSDEEKYWYMKNCEAFLFPSLSEGFGLPPIEAMRLGKPVFLSTCTSLPEIGGEHAYYFESFEPKAMKKVLEEGLKDYKDNKKKKAIKAWSEQFSWQRTAEAYTEVYNRLLNIPKTVKQTTGITAIIPTFNEEIHIKSVIESVLFADEIIIIDSFSTDDTLKIAQNYPVKILQRPFDNFSAQKNYALQHASNDWVLFLDADEQLSPTLQHEISELVQNNPKYVAFEFDLNYYFLNQLMRYGSFQTKKVIRLFNKNYCSYNGKYVHETLNISGDTGTVSEPITHKNIYNRSHFINKQRHYAKLKARQTFKLKTGKSTFWKYIKAAYRFVMHYIIRLGFLDGKAGFEFAKIQAQGILMRYEYLDHYRNMSNDLIHALKHLKSSGTILYPTDTVWGIGCDATDEKAVRKIFDLKQRHESKSMVILVDSIAMLQTIIDDIPQKVFELLAQNETPTSIIYNNPKGLASGVVAQDNTVAIRLVNDDFCQLLIQQLGRPIVSTSANISEHPTPKSFSDISDAIKNKVDYTVTWRQDENSQNKASGIIRINPDGSIDTIR